MLSQSLRGAHANDMSPTFGFKVLSFTIRKEKSKENPSLNSPVSDQLQELQGSTTKYDILPPRSYYIITSTVMNKY